MKKLLCLVLVLSLCLFGLASCGGSQNDAPKEEANRLSTSVANAMSSGSYTMTFNTVITDDEQKYDTTVELVKDKENSHFVVTSNAGKFSILELNDTTYMIDDFEKAYMKIDLDDIMDHNPAIDVTDDKLVFAESGSEDFNGSSMDFERYTIDEDEMITFYFSGKTLKGIKINDEDQDQTLEIIKFSPDVDKSIFALPEGYKEMKY
ncbi:MAG: hypothetical protein RR495_05255 [Anaerovoracaceae bacterium]